MVAPLKTGPWLLSDLKDVPINGLKVFSCFHCGGGSTMGYKLAGYEMLGGVDIDPEMMAIYRKNHNPKHSYLMGVGDFNKIPDQDIPPELFNLDILDGSPPCSSFSMAGARESKWGKESKFREGQAVQVLDDLFFDFIETAVKLKPKVVVAENVKGLIIGNAKGYVKEIFSGFSKAGYDCQLFLLNASRMGVPQKRERTFFIARRKDLNLSPIKLDFNEDKISCEAAFKGILDVKGEISKMAGELWKRVREGEGFSKAHPKGSWFNHYRLDSKEPSTTLIASGNLYHYKSARKLSDTEHFRIQSFPDDFNTLNQKSHYVCGMSVPPFMMQRVADQIEKQLLKKKFLSGEDLIAWQWLIKRRKSSFAAYYESKEGGSKRKKFNTQISYLTEPCLTITASSVPVSEIEPRFFTALEVLICQTFPLDYDFLKIDPNYAMGMSVPPFMMQRVANQIYIQWFSKSLEASRHEADIF